MADFKATDLDWGRLAILCLLFSLGPFVGPEVDGLRVDEGETIDLVPDLGG